MFDSKLIDTRSASSFKTERSSNSSTEVVGLHCCVWTYVSRCSMMCKFHSIEVLPNANLIRLLESHHTRDASLIGGLFASLSILSPSQGICYHQIRPHPLMGLDMKKASSPRCSVTTKWARTGTLTPDSTMTSPLFKGSKTLVNSTCWSTAADA